MITGIGKFGGDVRGLFPAMALGFAAVFSAVAEARPPEIQTVSQWADAARQIAPESGSPHPGKWVTARAPYLQEPQDCCGIDHPARECYIAGSAQSGKSEILLNAAFHCVDTDPRSILVLTPSRDKALQWNREKWEPNAQVTEAIRLKTFAQKGRSAEDSTSLYKRFAGGFLKIVSAGTAKELQASTIGLVILEEPTDYPADADGRGDPIRQAYHRLDAYGADGKMIGASTTGEKGRCRITALVEAGALCRYYIPCPDCGHYQVLRIENFGLHGVREPVLGFVCPANGCLIEEHQRAGFLEHGVWLATFTAEDPDSNPAPPRHFAPDELERWTGRDREGRYPSFHFWQAYSPFASWEKIHKEYKEAQQNPDLLKTFYQQVLAEPYEPAHDRPKHELVFDTMKAPGILRLARVVRGEVPPWASLITGAADVQGDRIEWAAWAWGPRAIGARFDRGVIPIDPDDPMAWTELAKVSRYVYEGPTLKPVTFDRFGCDTGGHHTSQAYLACHRHNVLALKGKPKDPDAAPLERGKLVKVKDDSGRIIAKIPLWLVGTFHLKSRVYRGLNQAALSLDSGQILPGSLFLEPDLTEADARQITAEYLVEDVVGGQKVRRWERPKWQANEQLDLTVYNLAEAIAWGIDRLNLEGWNRWASSRAKDPALEGAGPLEALMRSPDVAAGDVPPGPAGLVEDASEIETPDRPRAVNERGAQSVFRKDGLQSLSRINKGTDT
ncbi:terminase gpA endonuclease subunit [Marinicauda sp. Alg238-R41]|uniref:terminase gpA endonuclease subunit n=1 Tax=Marinicauda sp. Alg238-R41 TaxID=2993447 RepID=UPI0022E67B2E|nr:terminase gpA endonuclease subunit [Marinicauda sp. Alg238-R41]